MSTNGASGQIRSGGSNTSIAQNADNCPGSNGVGLAAMAQLSHDLSLYVPHNIQFAQDRMPILNPNHHHSDSQGLQHLAMLNLAYRQQQQWPPTSTLYPHFSQMNQYQQQMAAGASTSQNQNLVYNQGVETEEKKSAANSHREKRTISHSEMDLIEAEEMDNDPTTRVAGRSTPRKFRKLTRGSHEQYTQQSSEDDRNLHLGKEILNGQWNRDARSNKEANRETQRQLHVSSDACQFARTRYPFAPFGIILHDDIRDKLVVEHLVNAAKEKYQFALDIAGYRRVKTSDLNKVLIFVKTVESFTFLWNKKLWPEVICGKKYTLSMPSIPPQLSLVLPFVPHNTDMNELAADIQSIFPEVINVIRLKNRNQQAIKAVKLELSSDNVRKQILESKKLLVGGISYEVVEYMAQAHVLVCSQCMGIGHFRKNCPQQQTYTCSTCGEKTADSKQHKQQCTGVDKCIHCEGNHKSNDSKCPKIKDYRAALTKSLLNGRQSSIAPAFTLSNSSMDDFPTLGQVNKGGMGIRDLPSEHDGVGNKKMDLILDKVLDKLDRIEQQVAVFVNLIDERNRKDGLLEKKMDSLESKSNSIKEELCTTQSIILQLIDLLQTSLDNQVHPLGSNFVSKLGICRNSLQMLITTSRRNIEAQA